MTPAGEGGAAACLSRQLERHLVHDISKGGERSTAVGIELTGSTAYCA